MIARAGLGGALATAVIFCCLAASAVAAPQDLDTTFGTQGVAVGPTPGTGAGFVGGGTVRPDGSVYLVGVNGRSGSPFVVKLDPLGRRDTTFAPDGARETALPTNYRVMRVAIDDSGIFVAGVGPASTGFVARLRLDTGELMTTWGDSATPGIADLGLTDVTSIGGLALQSFGDLAGSRPVVLANRTPAAGSSVVRLSASGVTPDPGFGANGVRSSGVGAAGGDLVTTPLGIWALGATDNAFVVARYAAGDGTNADFGSSGRIAGGFLATPGTTRSQPNGLAVDGLGRAYVAGRLIESGGNEFAAVTRLAQTGARDTTFGSGGAFLLDDPGTPALPEVVADARGILAGGQEGADATRIGRTLVLDPDGKQLLATLRSGVAGDDLHRFVARNPDGRPVVGGDADAGLFVARFGGPNVAPAVTLTGPAQARPDQPFTLTATGTDADGDGGGLRYEWDVDGTPGFERSTGATNTLETQVSATGPFTARVRVTDASGKTSSPAEHTLTIAGNAFPVAAFAFTPAQPSAGVPVAFDGSASSDADGTITSYAWDFDGNGQTDATDVEPTFTFPAKGVYPVELRVTDDTGATDTEVQEITVATAGQPPVISELQSDAGSTTATINFRVEENGHAAADPRVLVGDRRFDATETATPGRFRAKVTDLAPLTTYSWRAQVTDAETGATLESPLLSFKTDHDGPVLTADIPATADAGGPFLFRFEAHDDTTADDKLKVSMKISRPPTAPEGSATFKGGETVIKDVRFSQPGTWRIDLLATDAQGVKTPLTRNVQVAPTPSFRLEGPTTQVAVGPGEATKIPIKIVRDAQGTAPVRLALSAPKSPQGVTANLGGAEKPSTADKAILSVKAPGSVAGKTFEVTISGTQQPTPVRDIGPRSITFEVRVIKPTDLVLDDVEVMQAVQKPLGTAKKYKGLPLVMGKTTLVRAYAHYTKKPEVHQVPAARLFVQGVTQPILPVHTPAQLFVGGPDIEDQRPKEEGWYHFLVPASTTAFKGSQKKLDYRVELDPPLAPGSGGEVLPMECEGCAANNTRRRNDVKYVASPSYAVRVIRAKYFDKENKELRTVEQNEVDPAMAPTRWVLPVARDEFTLVQSSKTLALGSGGTDYCTAVGKAEGGGDPEDVEDEKRDCIEELNDKAFDAIYASGVGKPPNGALILMHEGYTPGVARSSQGVGQVSTAARLRSVAHEVTHMIGREHADLICGGDSNGQDGELLTDDLGQFQGEHGLQYPAQAPWKFIGEEDYQYTPVDYMSYCDGTAWTSAAGWLLNGQLLFENLSRRGAPRQAATAGGLRVSAIVSGDRPRISRVRPVGPGEAAPAGTPSDFSFIARGAGGAVLAQVPAVAVAQDPPHDGGEATVAALAILPDGTLSVDLVRGADKLDTRDASASAPVVQVATPGGPLGGSLAPIEVRWTAADPDGEPLDLVVEYSSDGGGTWEPVHAGIETGAAGTAELDPRALRTSSQAKLRVTVTDGFRAATAESGVFATKAAPASVRILQPGKKLRPRAGLPVAAAATAVAPDGTPLTGKAVRWFLGKRLIGTGTEILTPPLPAGTSRLRVVAGGASAARVLKAAGGRPFFTKLTGKRRGRSARVTVAASAPGSLKLGRKRHAVGLRPRTLTVRVGRRTTKLPVRLTATGSSVKAKVRLR